MEQFLLRAKVEEWEHIEGRYVSYWVMGYLNLVGITETGPKFTFVQPVKDKCIMHMYSKDGEERYVYGPVEQSTFNKKTISRWTGICDRDGRKIFEGDILKFRMFRDEPDFVGIVEYDTPNCLYVLTGTQPNFGPFEVQVSSRDKSTFEIIGNRWDDPGLIKEYK